MLIYLFGKKKLVFTPFPVLIIQDQLITSGVIFCNFPSNNYYVNGVINNSPKKLSI